MSTLPLIWRNKSKTQRLFLNMFIIENVKSPQIHRWGLKESALILFFGPCIFIIEERTDQRNAQINLLLFKLLRHVSAT